MTSITLTPHQEQAIQQSLRTGLICSVDAGIDSAVEALPRPEAGFDPEKALLAGERIRKLRRSVTLDRGGISIREMAHMGHKY